MSAARNAPGVAVPAPALLGAVLSYLEKVSKDAALDEDEKDSLGVAVDCLQALSPAHLDRDAPFALEDLYRAYAAASATNSAPSVSSAAAPSGDGAATTAAEAAPLDPERRAKFLQFLRALHGRGFFRDIAEGSPEFEQRLEAARGKYNGRFADLAVGPVASLKIKLSELSQTASEEKAPAQPKEEKEEPPKKKEVTDAEREQATALKGEGNQLLMKKQFAGAVEKYSQAIELNPNDPVFYSNRAAAHTYLKRYKEAAADARRAIALDAKYVKAYVRLGVAELEQQNLESALEAYKTALSMTKPAAKSWETYQEMVTKIQARIDAKAQRGPANPGPGNPGAGAGAGGLPNMAGLGSLLQGLGAAGGPGGGGPGGAGGGLAGLLGNPMLQQMAQQFMKDPQMQQQVQDMMSRPDAMQQMAGLMNDPSVQNLMQGAMGGDDPEMQGLMQRVMADPQAAKSAMTRAMDDPEVQRLRQDPEVDALMERVKGGDFSAIAQLAQKPEAVGVLKTVMNKYLN